MGIDATRSEGNTDRLNGYLEGFVDGQKHFLDKACKILKNTMVDDVFANRGSVIKYMSVNEFVEYFRKVMEG